MPDVSEMGAMGFDRWRPWFIDAARLVCERAHPEALVIFFQTDIKHAGRWVDKGYLVTQGAEAAGAQLVWHKVVCRAPPGVTTFGRPSWAHMLAFSKALTFEPGESTPDVIAHLGEMPWARAMGVDACLAALQFVKKFTRADTIVDPFCGLGTVLAVAEHHGFNTIGVEKSAKRAEKARALTLTLE